MEQPSIHDQSPAKKYKVVCNGISGEVVDHLFPSQALLAVVMNIIDRTDINMLTKARLIDLEYKTLR